MRQDDSFSLRKRKSRTEKGCWNNRAKYEFMTSVNMFVSTHKEIYYNSNMNCNYTFPIDLASKGIPFGAKV